jgi:glycosyltransferase involved in cell wall biosynthesis
MESRAKICLVPRLSGIGGMVSFQGKLAAGLKAHNVDVCYDFDNSPYDAVLVIGGTRQLHRLWHVKRSGIPIVQRLDGMNWIHRVLDTGIRHWIRAEYGNFILANIRSTFADRIAYQSEFSRRWWERVRGNTLCQHEVIHNAVDLTEFSPGNNRNPPEEFIRILLVEGSLLGGYEFGLENAVKLTSQIAHSHKGSQLVELMIVGRVSPNIKNHWESWVESNNLKQSFRINWVGEVPHDQIADHYRNSHIYFSADINAACPNSVIEAIACGTPAGAFDTGALSELLGKSGGITVPYGGDPWQLESPDIPSLVYAFREILDNLTHYQDTARQRAESAFGLDQMVGRYLDLLLG